MQGCLITQPSCPAVGAALASRGLEGEDAGRHLRRVWPLQPAPAPFLIPPFPSATLLASAAADVAPPGLFSCSQQKDWGKCDALNDTGFCAVSCGRCTPDATNAPCDDLPTPDATSCSKVVPEGLLLQPAEPVGSRRSSRRLLP